MVYISFPHTCIEQGRSLSRRLPRAHTDAHPQMNVHARFLTLFVHAPRAHRWLSRPRRPVAAHPQSTPECWQCSLLLSRARVTHLRNPMTAWGVEDEGVKLGAVDTWHGDATQRPRKASISYGGRDLGMRVCDHGGATVKRGEIGCENAVDRAGEGFEGLARKPGLASCVSGSTSVCR